MDFKGIDMSISSLLISEPPRQGYSLPGSGRPCSQYRILACGHGSI